eukprot:m.18277 g.18277  ORF g.18277 m.18277 type:complete len:643 (+) comp27630_c0_seq1:1-1929(+)
MRIAVQTAKQRNEMSQDSVFAGVKRAVHASMVDADGKNVEIESREDEEQNAKLRQIVELLLAAGYFRARIKGLSPFDKIVGGMTWCIVTCSVDIDVDLLFQENSTIGQKIALTEKIVAVLPKMKCPHRIEPHQIQGLDFIHIYPVVQWLVRMAIETREELGDTIRMFSEFQFNKSHALPQDTEFKVKLGKAERAVKGVQEVYKPQRKFKRPSSRSGEDEATQVHSTLLEYGRRYGVGRQIPNEKDSEKAAKKKAIAAGLAGKSAADGEDEREAEERRIKSLMSGMAAMEDERLSSRAVASIVGQQSEAIQQMASEYATKKAELDEEQVDGVGGAQAHARKVTSLQKQMANLEKRLAEISSQHFELGEAYSKAQNELTEARGRRARIEEEMQKLDAMVTDENREVIQQLRGLVLLNEGLKKQEQQFKTHCKEEMTRLKEELARLEGSEGEGGDPEERERLEMIKKQYDADKAKLQKIRLLLARKNREIAQLQRKIDEVPSRTELSQYQRRFVELSNQMAATLTETKKFYTFYNTLDDQKLYLEKEVKLLNSINENFQTAMSSQANKAQFLKQMEGIVEGLEKNKAKVAEKKAQENAKRDDLQEEHTKFQQQQRLYSKTVREFQEECNKNEMLLAKLKSMGRTL